MRTNDKTLVENSAENRLESSKGSLKSQTLGELSLAIKPSSSLGLSYRELDQIPVREEDPIERLQENLEHLNYLQNKMQFLMRELRYLLKT